MEPVAGSGGQDGSSPATEPATRSGKPSPWRVERPPQEATGARPPHRRPSLWLLVFTLLALDWFLVLSAQPSTPAPLTVPYSYFVQQVQAGNVASATGQGAAIQGTFRHAITYPAQNGTTAAKFATERPAFAEDHLLSELLSHGAVVKAEPISSGQSPWVTILGGVLPTVLLVGFWLWIMTHWSGKLGEGGMFGIGRSRARKYQAAAQPTTFADVAGIDEAQQELAEVVDFLKHPDRYRRLGAEIPRGVLLSGRPGTGKTLLARAIAGEAGVPFYSISASEFVEMIVGVGASRVRDLFDQAKSDAPSIIFIDELDAIGRARGSAAVSGSNDEREQTLNQILTEMDGFTGNEGVIVIAATNRPEVLDPALLRPGRFDRRVTVDPPDQDGRLKILEVHTRKVPLKDGADLEAIAASTPGMVGADLKNLVNEAALGAARHGEATVSREDFTDALERITLGAARRIVIPKEERRRTAFHESGHALLGMLQPGADPVREISIIPHGQALGVTFQSPESDRYSYGESFLRGRLIGMLGGRAAELLVYGETSTGPESDLEQATSLARQMVGRWGMSERVGAVSALPRPGEESYAFPGSPGAASEHTLELVDEEVKRIINDCSEQARSTLAEHRDQLEHLAQKLLESETLGEAEAYDAAGVPLPSAELRPVAAGAHAAGHPDAGGA